MIQNLTIDCICGAMIPVEDLPYELHDEDTIYTPVITCKCGERYQVSLGLSLMGKASKE